MTALADALAAALPGLAQTAVAGALDDLCGHDLGVPAAIVHPGSTAEVAAVVAFARRHGVGVVVSGARTAYWRPLHVGGAIVLDLGRLDALGAVDPLRGATLCGAGASVRAVDDHLRRHGRCLAAHPDAYGETTLGALVATGMAAGVGMATASAHDLVAGVRAVLGSGAVVVTGAAAALGAPPFVLAGLPDVTGLLLASDGALGVVTEVAVRSVALPHQAQLRARLPDLPPSALAAALSALALPPIYDTLRVVREEGPGQTPGWCLDLRLHSPLSAAELEGRVAAGRAALAAAFGADVARGLATLHPGDAEFIGWQGAPGDHRRRLRGLRFAGLDVHLAWADLAAALAVAAGVVAAARPLPHASLRLSVYVAPEQVNLGVHMAFAGADEAAVAALLDAGRAAFAALPIVPYRWGRDWGDHLGARLDPGLQAALRACKAALDPDGVLHPGAGIFADAAAAGR